MIILMMMDASGDNNGSNSGYTDDELHSPLATIGSPTDNMYNNIHGSPQQGNIYPIQNRRNSIRNYAGDRRSPTTQIATVGLVSNGWLECWDAKAKQTYYFHPATGSTQWEHPRGTKLDPELVFRKRFKFLYTLHKEIFKCTTRCITFKNKAPNLYIPHITSLEILHLAIKICT